MPKTCVQCGEEIEYITEYESVTKSVKVTGLGYTCLNKECKNYGLVAIPKEDIPNKEV